MDAKQNQVQMLSNFGINAWRLECGSHQIKNDLSCSDRIFKN